MRNIILFILLVLLTNCTSTKNSQVVNNTQPTCKEILPILEKELFFSIPVSKSPTDIVSNLDGLENFKIEKQNETFVGVSKTYKSKNALFNDFQLNDEKSFLLLNHLKSRNDTEKENLILFQAVYFFENKIDFNSSLKKINRLLNEELKLKRKTHSDLKGTGYGRYILPCGFGFNFKHSQPDDSEYVIDIIWAPYP